MCSRNRVCCSRGIGPVPARTRSADTSRIRNAPPPMSVRGRVRRARDDAVINRRRQPIEDARLEQRELPAVQVAGRPHDPVVVHACTLDDVAARPRLSPRSRRLPESESLVFQSSRSVAPASISSTDDCFAHASTQQTSTDECGIRHLRLQRRSPPPAAPGDVALDQTVAGRSARAPGGACAARLPPPHVSTNRNSAPPEISVTLRSSNRPGSAYQRASSDSTFSEPLTVYRQFGTVASRTAS